MIIKNKYRILLTVFTLLFPAIVIVVAVIFASIWPIVKTLTTEPTEALRQT